MKIRPEGVRVEREMILEMMEASRELARRLGKHPLKRGCNCISCVNKRKLLIQGGRKEWQYVL